MRSLTACFRLQGLTTAVVVAVGLLLLEPFGPTAHAQGLQFNSAKFFSGYHQQFGGLNQNQVNGLNQLLTSIEHDGNVRDVRWIAYMLATVQWECAGTYHPISEYGMGRGHPYGNPVRAPNGTWQVYYGRGYVQLTWEANYINMGRNLGMGNNLANNPSLALNPTIAYKIMSYGMVHGSFTGARLSTYINSHTTDYVNARRIINGLDHASTIAGYAHKWETILRGSLK
jgi:putative chitinase